MEKPTCFAQIVYNFRYQISLFSAFLIEIKSSDFGKKEGEISIFIHSKLKIVTKNDKNNFFER